MLGNIQAHQFVLLGNIQAHQFVLRVRPQADGVLDQLEHDGDDNSHIQCHGEHAQGLYTQQAKAAAIK